MSILSLALDTPSLASHYEHVSRERQFKAGQVLVEKLRIERGQHVLDVGSGTGLLAEHVAGIAYDLTSFDVDTFDAVYLNAVFHWLPQKTEPLRQFYRVLKPGGRLGISTGSKDHISPLQQIRRAVLARDLYRSYPESDAGFPNRVGRDELEALLEQAGFDRVSVEVTPHVQFQPTPAAAVEFAQASSFGNFLSHLPPELGRSARAEIEAELAGLTTSEGIRQEGARLIAIASKPRAA